MVTGSPKQLFALLFLFAAVACASASDIYFAQNAQGANTGADCADAFAFSDSNSGINVQSRWAPGNTLRLCGTISVPAGANAISVKSSGSSGSPITIKFEPGAILQSQYFGSGGSAAIVMNGKSYITIDGGTNGTIRNTANGTSGSSCPGGTCSYQQASTFIQADCATNCEIENLTLGPNYLRTSGGDSAPCGFSNEAAIFISGSSASNNFLIHDNTIHDGRWINTFEFGNGSNFQFYNNTVYASGHAIALEIGSNSKFTGMYIYGNHIYDFTQWAGNGCFHNNSIHVFQSGANTTGSIVGLYIYNNEFDGSMAGNSTDQIYLEPNGNVNSVGTAWVFNNILSFAGDETGGDGLLGAFAGGTSMFVANNTLIGNASNQGRANETCAGADQPIGTTTWTNNIATACNVLWYGKTASSGGPKFASGFPDYNLWANGLGNGWQVNGQFYSAIADWRSHIGNATHDSYQSSSPLPQCNGIHDCSNVRPQSGSSAIGFAQNLYNTCNGQPVPGLGALCYDKPEKIGPGGNTLGNLRPASGTWDAGAYQSGGGSGTPPAAPTGLAAVAN